MFWFSLGHRSGPWWTMSHTFANPDLGLYACPQSFRPRQVPWLTALPRHRFPMAP